MRKWYEDNPESYEKHKARLRLRYAENPNKFKKRVKKYVESHPKWKKEYDENYRETNEKQVKQSIKNWRENNPDYLKEHKRISYQQIQKDPIKKKELYKNQKKTRDKLKIDVTLHYSKLDSKTPNCVCCKESNMNMLTIGSKNGSHSDKIQLYGGHFYHWLRKTWPSRSDWQTECWNCNTGKEIAGTEYCPHIKEIEKEYTKKQEYKLKVKTEVTLYYSKLGSMIPNCICCNESKLNMLTIGSKNDQHTKKINKHGQNFYLWLRRNWPPKSEWQTECWNCNTGKQIAGSKTCPHKLKQQ